MTAPEHNFPTIRDARDRLAELTEQGLGDLPIQILVVPDSTMQAVARATGGPDYNGDLPALMIELTGAPPTARLPVSLISTERLTGGGMPARGMQ